MSPEELREHTTRITRDCVYRKKHGITIEEYDALLVGAGGQCAICKGNRGNRKTLHLDHCHKTNKVRGVLCSLCNMALGSMDDNIEFLEAAIAYLEENK